MYLAAYKILEEWECSLSKITKLHVNHVSLNLFYCECTKQTKYLNASKIDLKLVFYKENDQ